MQCHNCLHPDDFFLHVLERDPHSLAVKCTFIKLCSIRHYHLIKLPAPLPIWKRWHPSSIIFMQQYNCSYLSVFVWILRAPFFKFITCLKNYDDLFLTGETGVLQPSLLVQLEDVNKYDKQDTYDYLKGHNSNLWSLTASAPSIKGAYTNAKGGCKESW